MRRCGRCREAERDALPLLARGAALRFLLTRLVDWFDVPPGALVRPKDPLEYYRKLRFHQAVASARDYGIEGMSEPHVVIHTDGACSGNPGPGRLGRDPRLRRSREGAQGRRGAHHQQPHGADGGDRGAGSAQAALPGRPPHRQPIPAQRHHVVDQRNGSATAGAPPTRSRSRTSTCGSGSTRRWRSIACAGTG